jgi:hypothetical protein
MINIKFCQVPGNAIDQTLLDGATAQDSIDASGVTQRSSDVLKVNGVDASPDTVLSEGSRVMLVQGAKGNTLI